MSNLLIIAATTVTTDPLSALLSYGPLGIAFFLFVIGKLRTEGEVKSLESRLEGKDIIIKQKDEQIVRLQESITDKVIPIMTRSTQVLERLAERSQ